MLDADYQLVIPGRGRKAANPESITRALRRMDSGSAAFAASRNDGENRAVRMRRYILRSFSRKREPSSFFGAIKLLSWVPAFAGTNGGEA